MTMQESGKNSVFLLLLGAVFSISTCIKVLLIPAYRSTDFEVHRNWLAITHSFPLSQWYYENSSQWTLDYPPFFAWFECFLSYPAALIDPLIVSVKSLDYASSACIFYQRFTVMGSDLTLLYAIHQYHNYQTSKSHDQRALLKSLVVGVLVLLNYGLLVVDHIHFQYNGFLFGLLLLSIVRIMQGRHLEGGFWFAVLVNLKHIFLYLAPAYFVYLLKHYCFHLNSSPSSPQFPSFSLFLPINFLKLGSVVAVVFLLSFGPFLVLGQLGQILSQLFPFKRGLCHAYWAPNAWALYSFTDMLAASLGQRFGVWSVSCAADSGRCGSMTSGLVGEMGFKVLPHISPAVTLVVTCLAMLPSLVKVWVRETSSSHGFLKVLILCAYSSFLFGWHVHEKAILLITIPMSLLAVEEAKFSGVFVFLSTVAHVSLFPLLHQPAETPVKLTLFVACTCMTFLSVGVALSLHHLPLTPRTSGELPVESQAAADTPAPMDTNPLGLKQDMPSHTSPRHAGQGWGWPLSRFQAIYIVFVLLVQVYCVFVHGFGPLKRLEFLPLLLTSVSCAVAVFSSWGHFLQLFLSH